MQFGHKIGIIYISLVWPTGCVKLNGVVTEEGLDYFKRMLQKLNWNGFIAFNFNVLSTSTNQTCK